MMCNVVVISQMGYVTWLGYHRCLIVISLMCCDTENASYRGCYCEGNCHKEPISCTWDKLKSDHSLSKDWSADAVTVAHSMVTPLVRPGLRSLLLVPYNFPTPTVAIASYA